MKKWMAYIDQNSGEYTGWVSFFADNVERGSESSVLIVDGRVMEFDEGVLSFEEVTY